MDTPRRWQVASLVTAVAGLGLGGLMVGRSPVVEVAPIHLDATTSISPDERPSLDRPVPDTDEIVPPRIREDGLTTITTGPTDSLASPAAPPASSTPAAPQGGTTTTGGAEPAGSIDAPDDLDTPEGLVPHDSSDSLDTPESVDSLDSVSD